MLRLDLDRAPDWLELAPGVRVLAEPASTSLMIAARAEVARTVADDADRETLGLAMAKALGRLAIRDWEGVGDAAGRPVPVTPEGVDALLEVFGIFEAWQERYVARALALELEKNASAPSPAGTSAGAPSTAPTAEAPVPTAPRRSTRRGPARG
ncbi:MAG: hypothetical protein ACXIU8_12465 [Alkalilacustris sp.]